MHARLRTLSRALVAIGTGLALASAASAQLQRPSAAQRVVKLWDFDAADGAIEPVPRGWYRAQDSTAAGRARPGYPAFNAAYLDFEHAASGEFSMKLPTQGGSTSLMLSAGVIPAIPQADYIVRSRVRTEGLRHASARFSVWLLDAERELIPESVSRSRAVRTSGDWTIIDTDLRGVEHATWIQIELELLQPALLIEPGKRRTGVAPEDFSGAAWFDDVTILQAPRLGLGTNSPVNIIVDPERPDLVISVRDLTGESLDVEVEVYGLTGELVDDHELTLPRITRREIWTPTLPAYGWYRGVMRVSSKAGPIGVRYVDFIWCPEGEEIDPALRQSFGLIAEHVTPEQRELLPQLVRGAQTGAIHLAVWDERTTIASVDETATELSAVSERLLDQHQELTFVLAVVPEVLAERARVDRDNPIPILLEEADYWAPYLARMLSKFGERVRRWQLGATGANRAFFRNDLTSDVERIRTELRRLVPRPGIALPWGAEQPPPRSVEHLESLSVTWPAGVPASWARELMRDWPGEPERRVVLEAIDHESFGQRAQVIDLFRRAVLAWSVGERLLAIDSPWDSAFGHDRDSLMPRAALASWRTLVQTLSERDIVGTLPVADGASVFIASGPEGNVLIGWSDGADPEAATIRGYLGPGPIVAIDPFGNRTPIRPVSTNHYEIPLGEMPVIIQGIDSELAQFRASLRLEPGFLPARAERHEVSLVVENPWNIGITGRIRISDPEEWTITPRVIPLRLDAGETARFPIEISFSLGEEAGLQNVVAQVEVLAQQRYPVQMVPMDLEIGLTTVEIIPSHRIERTEDGRLDAIVSMRIINRGDEPLTIEAFAQAPGYRREFRPISRLAPGATTTRYFRYQDGGTRLLGRTVRVGVRENDGTGRLNMSLKIE